MEALEYQPLKSQLEERKEKLLKAIDTNPGNPGFTDLLQQVDAALERIDHHTYGICEICSEEIEKEKLLIDPLTTVCLSHMNREQQRALEADLQFAAQIQGGLLPENNLTLNGWEFSYHYKPAGIVSGDFCDFIPAADNSVLFAVGDVSGKGISASMLMSQLHALIRSLMTFNLPVNEIVKKTNRLFCESMIQSNYATLVLGRAGVDGSFEVCVAGHNPPLLLQNGKLTSLSATGVPVGLFCGSEYTVHKFKLERDDYLLLYTDGLTESDSGGEEYGPGRIEEHLIKLNGGCSGEIIKSLLLDHKNFLKDLQPKDDVTVAVIRRI